MSNQFYKYIGDQLVAFFEEEAATEKSNRYYLHLPSNEHVRALYDVLGSHQKSGPFHYQHEEGQATYETTAFTFGKMTYVIATTSAETTIDFLVTLRNEMSEQVGQWENTSLLFISDSLNDSIRGGSIDITSEGLPLHVKQLVGNLDEMVEESVIPVGQKEMIHHYLKSRLSGLSIENTSFLDFEDILAILNKNEMSASDYLHLHYFPDDHLSELVKERESLPYESRDWKNVQKAIDHRLDKNNQQYEEIDSIRSLGNAKERLVEKFDKGGELLNKDEWYMIDFASIEQWEEKVKSTQDIAFLPEKVKVSLKDNQAELEHWQRPQSLTKAGQRSWHFLVFYPAYEVGDQIELTLPFDRHTKKEFLNRASTSTTESKGHALVTNVKLEKAGVTFQRVTYKHENVAKSNFVFHIAVIGWPKDIFKQQNDSFLIRTTPKRQQALQFTLDNSKLILGEDEGDKITLASNSEVVEINSAAEISFESGILEEGETSLRFILKHHENELPIEIKDEMLKRIPISANKLWELKRIKQSSFYIDQSLGKVAIDHLPYSTYEKDRPFLQMEFDWLRERMRQAELRYERLLPELTKLPAELELAYDAFLDAVMDTGTIPSLLYYSDEVRKKAKDYVAAFISEVEAIEENQVMTAQQRSLFYLGTVRDKQKVYLTPFSPLNVVYQLELDRASEGEAIDPNILQRLNAAFTLPYLVDQQGRLYKPTTDNPLPEWHTYLPQENVTVGETSLYLAKVIQEKLEQFTHHYDYLFQIDDSAAVLLNVIHIPNDEEILRGIINWLKEEIKNKQSLSNIRNVKITIYNDDKDRISAFDIFNNATDAAELKEKFNLSFAMKDMPENDVLRAIQNALHYTKQDNYNEVAYAHLTFYKMKGEERIVRQVVSDMPNSLNLNGLFTTNVFKKAEHGYRVGFGTGDSDYRRTTLTHFATKINELAVNMLNKGQDPYQKNCAFAMQTGEDDQAALENLYEQSNWLVFIDPIVDLNYFDSSSKNLVVVHYSDQYSPSSYYDAITVTDKTEQYQYVIDTFLQSQNVTADTDQINAIIRTFNTFNGEWLLRAVQNRAYDKREKMSIVSAIKQALNLFDKPNIMWVPLSMEEIVRVTGSVKLSRKAGLFSGKTIGTTGNCSDDLLMMGLEIKEDDLYLHMYPVEVKVGHNGTHVIDKGIEQVHELKRRLHEHLVDDISFDAKFLRNFFIRLFINNVSKMEQNKIWPERNYSLSSTVMDKLLNDDFQIVDTLQADFGQGIIISFRKDVSVASRERRQGVVILTYPEQLGYESLPIPIAELDNQATNSVTKVVPKIVGHETANVSVTEDLPAPPQESRKVQEQALGEEGQSLIADASETYLVEETTGEVIGEDTSGEPAIQQITHQALDEVRPLVGMTGNMSVHWEFSHHSLSNRHLLIGGRSGQGKTYFIQALLQDLAKTNQSAVVLDYSSSYTLGQLDPVFVEQMGDKLQERIVYYEGFPLNPFLLRDKEVSGKIFEERPTEAATRIAAVFASVYRSFGEQQKAALYDAIMRGLEKYKNKFTMTLLLEELAALEGYTNQVIMSITSRLTQFAHIDPFDYEVENQWDAYFAPGGNITIIQLAGYDQDEIKRLLAEFILWDLWYYSQNGTKDKAIPVILDEAQNLDFSDGSPSAKILREGRKFGWSAWFATQTFNNFSKTELSILDNAGTKVYFNPVESEVRQIANRLGDVMPDELRMLKKGQCLVAGQFAQDDGKLGTPTYHIVNVPAMDGPERE